MIFRPKNKYNIKKEIKIQWKIVIYVLAFIGVFLLGFFTSGPIIHLFK